MSRCRWSVAQLHGTALAGRLDPAERKAMGIESDAEIAARVDREGERVLQATCENLLRLRGLEFLHLSSRSRQSEGWPDLVFCLNGAFVAVELKTPEGKTTPPQNRILAQLAANGADVHVCRAVEQFRAILDGRGDETRVTP